MNPKVTWSILGFLLLAIFVLTFMKPPEAIAALLTAVSADARTYSLLVHIACVFVFVSGLLVAGLRTKLYSFFMAFLSLSATVVAVVYMIIPNIIVFAIFSVLIIHAYATRQLSFPLENIRSLDLLFGGLALVFGFWYLHWVEDPIWINALLYSPLGVVNCPTMLMVCGFLCLSQQPRSPFLEGTVALITLYFGFFGLFRLGAYVDVTLILCALFLLARLTASMTRERVLRESDSTG